jgi:hypothetical protein
VSGWSKVWIASGWTIINLVSSHTCMACHQYVPACESQNHSFGKKCSYIVHTCRVTAYFEDIDFMQWSHLHGLSQVCILISVTKRIYFSEQTDINSKFVTNENSQMCYHVIPLEDLINWTHRYGVYMLSSVWSLTYLTSLPPITLQYFLNVSKLHGLTQVCTLLWTTIPPLV